MDLIDLAVGVAWPLAVLVVGWRVVSALWEIWRIHTQNWAELAGVKDALADVQRDFQTAGEAFHAFAATCEGGQRNHAERLEKLEQALKGAPTPAVDRHKAEVLQRFR